VDLTSEEALIFLEQWRTEKRIVQFTVVFGDCVIKVVGQVDGITNDVLRVSGKEFVERGLGELGSANNATFPLLNASFDYVEGHHTGVREWHQWDALLSMEHSNGLGAVLMVLPYLE
jgi:hypothetical protein